MQLEKMFISMILLAMKSRENLARMKNVLNKQFEKQFKETENELEKEIKSLIKGGN